MLTQRYVSRELTHFVGACLKGQTDFEDRQYRLLLKILRQGRLEGPLRECDLDIMMRGKPHGVSLSSNAKFEVQKICFCDIPIEDLGIHMQKYSRFGLAFTKKFLVARGATPVFYVSQDALITDPHLGFALSQKTTLPVRYREVFDSFAAEWERFCILERTKLPAGHFLLEQQLNWLLFAQLKFFDSSRDEDHDGNFYMEREWRVLRTVSFALDDVIRVVLPGSYSRRFRDDLPDYCGQLTFADYD